MAVAGATAVPDTVWVVTTSRSREQPPHNGDSVVVQSGLALMQGKTDKQKGLYPKLRAVLKCCTLPFYKVQCTRRWDKNRLQPNIRAHTHAPL